MAVAGDERLAEHPTRDRKPKPASCRPRSSGGTPEPPGSDPLVVSEWWARRNTELFDEELRETALGMELRLQRLGVERTERATRRALGPVVLARLAFAVRR